MISTHTVFDAEWYLARNPDVSAAVSAGLISALEHFELFGKTESRAPGPLFDPEYYLSANPDVADAVEQGLITATEHFLQFGVAEDRSPLPVFDSAFYLERNPDIAAAVHEGLMTPTEHFLLHGHGEPRLIDPFIDLGAYLRANNDVAEQHADSGLSPLTHLLTHGLNEGRELGNGIDLGIFANDPVFQNAVDSGDSTGALARVKEIAPFLPTFVPPVGWVAPADTPIPLNFIPPEGIKLVVPPSVVIPPGMQLPSYFEVSQSVDRKEPNEPEKPADPEVSEPKEPEPELPEPEQPEPEEPDPEEPRPEKPQPEEPEPEEPEPEEPRPEEPEDPSEPTDPEESEDSTFWVSHTGGKHSFHGTATGEIRIVIDGSTINFTRGDHEVQSEIDLDDWTLGKDVIILAPDQTLVLDPQQAVYMSMATLGAPDVAFDGTGTILIEANDLRFDSMAELASDITVNPALYSAATGGSVPAGGDETVPMPANLLSISPTLSLKFAGEGVVNVGENVLLMIQAHHADGLSITGDGSAVVFGPNLLELLDASDMSDAVALPFPGLGNADTLGPIELNISTIGLNFITATSGDDLIIVGNGHENVIYAGRGKDTIELSEAGNSIILIMAGEPDDGILSDSSIGQMDEISGFTIGQDKIVAGHPSSLNGIEAASTSTPTTINCIDFSITKGMASMPRGADLGALLEALSTHLGTAREAVGFEYGGSTYLLYGDGDSALTDYDMVVKLVGVTGVSDIGDLVGLASEAS